MLTTFALFLLSSAATAPVGDAAAAAAAEPNPKAMTASQIREHNSKLERKHPHFIRCVRSANTGTLVARNVSCRTNQQWAIAERVGNDEVREIGDKMASKFWDFERAGR
jgi:hypothetical protein